MMISPSPIFVLKSTMSLKMKLCERWGYFCFI